MQENLIENQVEFDSYIKELADMVVQHQGEQFDSYKEAQAHVENTATQLHQLLQGSNALFVEGLQHLIKTEYRPAADIARSIYDHLHSPTDVAEIIDTQIIRNKDALKAFSEAVNSFYGVGDFHVEESVISVLLTLFPMEPQPFSCLGTMIWRKEGLAEAVAYYEKIVDLFESPLLDYFAADCYYKAGHKGDAKKLLDRAVSRAADSPQLHEDIMPLIRISLRNFQSFIE